MIYAYLTAAALIALTVHAAIRRRQIHRRLDQLTERIDEHIDHGNHNAKT